MVQHPFPTITVDELATRLDGDPELVVLDVRTPPEYASRRIPGAVLIPLQELPDRVEDVRALRAPVHVTCEHGVRSWNACAFLSSHGIDVVNIHQGMHRWRGPVERG